MKRNNSIRKFMFTLTLLLALTSWTKVWGQTQTYNSIDEAKQAAIAELTANDKAVLWGLIDDYRTNKNPNLPSKDVLDQQFSISTGEVPYSPIENTEEGNWNKRRYYFVTTITYRNGGAGSWPNNVMDAQAAAGITLQEQTDIAGKASKDIYVQTGESRLIRLQNSGAENLDGFIHWYFEDTSNNSLIAWNGTIDTGEAFSFANGLAWLRGMNDTSFTLRIKHEYTRQGYILAGYTYQLTGSWVKADNGYSGYGYTSSSNEDNMAPEEVCAVQFSAPSTTGTYQLYCDASAVNNAAQGGNNTVITPKVAVQTVYNIHVVDGSRLKTESPISENGLDLSKIANFLESYEIHTSNNGTTNFRLNEPLANYLVPNSLIVPEQVRWRQYDASGNYISDTEDTTDGNIVSYTFTETYAKQIYITAEVSVDNTNWYPVSLLKVYLEPNAEPLTQSELDSKDAGYDQRKENYLTQHGYEQIAEMTFGTAEGEVTKENNFATEIPEGLNSAYAFADLTEFQYRRANRMNVGRGEYGLYRTLNRSGISTPSDTYTVGDETGAYNDYFATTQGYNNYILDHTGNGYFFYLDATDEPGVITRIKLPELCSNTTLLVSAWICDMAHSSGASHADVGFTIKRKSSDGEEVLTRYYSGAVHNKPDFGTSNQQAEWQQVFFRFTFTDGSVDDEYYVEISSNTPNSNGADYAIDDIRVYKSSPDIRVDRLDACTSSILQIFSPYERILTNMGWQENEVLDDSKSEDAQYEGYLYFAFFDDNEEWVAVNNNVEAPGLGRDALKVWISTRKESIPTTREGAASKEAILNNGNTGSQHIYVPWLGADGTLHITEQLNVTDTDLKYIGEPIGEGETASGEYNVILFSQTQAEAGMDYLNKTDRCALGSSFKVKGSTTIVIETATNTSTALCAGALRKITASLNGYAKNMGKPIDLEQNGIQYIFDWYLGSKTEYDRYTASNNNISIKTMLAAIRLALGTGGNPYTDEITVAQLEGYTGEYKNAVLALINDGKLRTGTQPGKPFSLIVEETEIVALPLVYAENDQYEYCTEETVVTLPVEESDIPELYPGFDSENAPQLISAPLRLGLQHLNEIISNIPIRKDIKVTVEGATLKAENAPIYLNDPDNDYPEVGNVVSLYAAANEGGQFTISFTTTNSYVQAFREGESYKLLVPFAQYSASGKLLDAACDGLATFTIKIVPAYLTWQGDKETDAWYNDGNWHQSTKRELFKGITDEDANGTDDVEKAFAPLYFTKITIPEDQQLNLETDIPGENEIQYDMAVDTVIDGDTKIQIVPYYINKVDEIYFKPGATLMNQHLLTYNKAWVEFILQNNQPNWMASPLHATYAGDFYAPKEEGSKDTPAFEDINYSTDVNSRWGLPFYQKAWSKAVAYSLNTDGTSFSDVTAVQSNWSIEYNDVWVPYSIGKGFYVRYGEGEDKEKEQVKVRLPKADTNYGYETKALSTAPGTRTNAYRLAGTQTGENGKVSVELSAVDGDGTHYLIGNPYMTYLDMATFFEENKDVLAAKYWTLENGATAGHVVGTPDVAFDEQAAGYVAGTGTVAPMQAFFVELTSIPEGQAEDEEATTSSKTITFTSKMMAPTAEGLSETQTTSLRLAAINPMITLTATCSDLRSHATLLAADDANNGYEAAEDAVVLIDSELRAPIAYSVAGSQAAQVNAVKEIRNVGLGVYAEGNREVTLTLSGLDRFATSLSLYDAQTRTSQRLDGDSFSLTVSGSSHGRYFLRSEQPTGTEAIGAQGITIYAAEPGKVIIDALQPIRRIQVFRLNGAQERNWEVNSTHQTLYLPAGIYMIHVSDGTNAQVEKVIVR